MEKRRREVSHPIRMAVGGAVKVRGVKLGAELRQSALLSWKSGMRKCSKTIQIIKKKCGSDVNIFPGVAFI